MYFPLLFLVQFCSSPSFSTAAGHCGKPSYCVWSWPHLSIPCNYCPASSGIDPLLASDLPPHSLAVSHHTHFGAPSVVPSCSAIYCACTHTHSSNSLSFIFIFLLPPPLFQVYPFVASVLAVAVAFASCAASRLTFGGRRCLKAHPPRAS